MNFKIFLFLVLHILRNAHANYLECYVCKDCEESEGHPVSCALLGELQLIDPTPNTMNGTTFITTSEKESTISVKPTTSSQTSAESMTTLSSLINNGTLTPTIEAAFEMTTTSESIKTTAVTLDAHITTPADNISESPTSSRPQVIVDSMESYEDMEYDFGDPTNASSAQSQNNTKKTTNILGVTGSANETFVHTTIAPLTTNNTSLTEENEGDKFRPSNESSVDSTLIFNSTKSPVLTANTTDVLGLSGTSNESSIFAPILERPNNTNLTEFNSTRFENATLKPQAVSKENSEEDFSESEEDFPWLRRSNASFETNRRDRIMLSAEGSTNANPKERPTQFLRYKYSKMSYATEMKQMNITYKCYSVQVEGHNKVQINKGCIAVPPKRTACELLSLKYGEKTLKDCQVCLEDKCNRNYSDALKFSFKSLLALILIAWLLN